MASTKDCFCAVFESSGAREWFSLLSDCLLHAVKHGARVREVNVEQPDLSSFCAELSGHTAPTAILREWAEYFQPLTSQDSRHSTSSKQLQLVNTSNDENLEAHLLYACVHCLPEALELVLDNSTDLDLNSPLASTEEGLTPLSWSALHGGALCKQLIGSGASVDVRDGSGRTALHWAIVGGTLSAVKALLKHGIDTAITDDKGFTPLHLSCVLGLQEIVLAVVKESPDQVDVVHQPTGSTSLMLACSQGHYGIAKLLLGHRASNVLTNKQGLTALHCAVWSGEIKCVKTVLASANREILDARDCYGRTSLHIAAFKGDLPVCRLLVKKGCMLSAKDNADRTPLHWAVLSQQSTCVEWLCEQEDGLVTQGDSQGATPLHYAVTGPSELLVEMLLSKGADATVKDSTGQTPLVWALVFAWEASLQPLMVGEVWGALLSAARVGAEEACRTITQHNKESVTCADSEGLTALHQASWFGHDLCVSLLLQTGAAVDILSANQESSLHLACSSGHAHCTEILLNNGANQRLLLNGQWPVHIVCCKGFANVLEVLLSHDPGVLDVPQPDQGHTPLHLAALAGHLECCQVLVDRGCDKTAAALNAVEQHTALDLAMLSKHTDCVEYLLSVGTPSGGGHYHRAALTIQAVWKLHRYKRRMRARREWCAIVLQRALRDWLVRRAVTRVQQARQKHKEQAATIIQRHWKAFIQLKRRYEASCAKLRARLQRETIATTLILSQLHLNAQTVSLPPPVTSRAIHHISPRQLLLASSGPASVFPSGSLLFPAKPRTPLTRTHPLRTQVSQLTRPRQLSISSEDKVQLPPITSRSRTQHQEKNRAPLESEHFETIKSSKCNGASNQDESLEQSPPIASEIPQDSFIVCADNGNNIPTSQPNTPTPQSHTPTSSIDRLPSVPTQHSLISVHKMSNTPTSQPYTPTPQPHTPTSSVDRLPLVLTQHSPISVHSGTDRSRRSAIKLPCQAQLKLARRSMFKDTPVKALVSQHQTMKRKEDSLGLSKRFLDHRTEQVELPRLENSSKTGIKLQRDSVDSNTPLPSEILAGVDNELLNNIQRYDKLNEVLGLLHQAREAPDCKEQDGVKLSHLKEQISGALNEAVRLRADTQALAHKVNDQAVSSKY